MDLHSEIKKLNLPDSDSHKGKNGKLMVIGGSHFFHAASLWSLLIASRLVDLVHYSSVPENNRIVARHKEEFRDGIVVPRIDIEKYIEEDDCVLIGPGMNRDDNPKISDYQVTISNLEEISKIENEGEQTYHLTKYLLTKYPKKRWVIDAGSLQMLELEWIPPNAILTPHFQEFERLVAKIKNPRMRDRFRPLLLEDQAKLFAREFHCIVILKGKQDFVVSDTQFQVIEGGNAGMTKGGTGDVLAGLVSGLYCSNDPYLSALAASYINKKAGEDLFQTVGYWFNASDLANQIPKTMKSLLI
jgi:NAD(P)H-hydrate epimerase